eukprot:2863311-Alexandrium_andersonii.AAC.1
MAGLAKQGTLRGPRAVWNWTAIAMHGYPEAAQADCQTSPGKWPAICPGQSGFNDQVGRCERWSGDANI